MSYKSAGNLRQHINNSHDLAYKHSRVAEGINEQEYRNPERMCLGSFTILKDIPLLLCNFT